MAKEERVAVYIDGSNFYRKLKDPQIGYTTGKIFDFKKLVEHLVGERTLISKRYSFSGSGEYDKKPDFITFMGIAGNLKAVHCSIN